MKSRLKYIGLIFFSLIIMLININVADAASQTVISPPGDKFLVCNEDLIIGCTYTGQRKFDKMGNSTNNYRNYAITVYFAEYGNEKTKTTNNIVRSKYSGVYLGINYQQGGIGAEVERDIPNFSIGFDAATYKSKEKYYQDTNKVITKGQSASVIEDLVQDLTNNNDMTLNKIKNVTLKSQKTISTNNGKATFSCPSNLVFKYKDKTLNIELTDSAAIPNKYSGFALNLGAKNIEYLDDSNSAASFFGSNGEFIANENEINKFLNNKTCKLSDTTTKVDTGEEIKKSDTENVTKDSKQFTCKYRYDYYNYRRCVTLTIAPKSGYIDFKEEKDPKDLSTSYESKKASYNAFFKANNNVLYKNSSNGLSLKTSFGYDYSDSFKDYYIENDGKYDCLETLKHGIASNGGYNVVVPKDSKLYDFPNIRSVIERNIQLDQNCQVGYLSSLGKGNFNWNNCKGLLGDVETPGTTAYVLNKIFFIFKIIAPILVIVLSVLGFLKAFLAQDNDALKKESKKFMIRLILAIALFLLPMILQFILNIAVGEGAFCGIF